jgi:hypothetical protein
MRPTALPPISIRSLRKKRLGLGVLRRGPGYRSEKERAPVEVHFGSLEKMRQAQPYELVEYMGVSPWRWLKP